MLKLVISKPELATFESATPEVVEKIVEKPVEKIVEKEVIKNVDNPLHLTQIRSLEDEIANWKRGPAIDIVCCKGCWYSNQGRR